MSDSEPEAIKQEELGPEWEMISSVMVGPKGVTKATNKVTGIEVLIIYIPHAPSPYTVKYKKHVWAGKRLMHMMYSVSRDTKDA